MLIAAIIVLYILGAIMFFFTVGPDEDEKGSEYLMSWVCLFLWPVVAVVFIGVACIDSIRYR
jgi:hypothetical protein